MDKYNTVKHILDTLCDQKDIKSWTIHENKFGTVCTIRLVDTDTVTRGNTPTPKTTTFKQKSRYQVQRDKDRMDSFNNRANTRSQTVVESNRDGDNSTNIMCESNQSRISSFCSSHAASVDSLHCDIDHPSLDSPVAPLLS